VSDKLQEIKAEVKRKEQSSAANTFYSVGKMLNDMKWLIEKLEQEKNKVKAVKEALANGPQPCPGGVTAEQYNAWLYSVLPFLEECELDESSSITSNDN